MRKKLFLFAACLIGVTFASQAQLGDVLNRAAKRAAQKVTSKMVDKAVDAATESVNQSLDSVQSQSPSAPEATVASLMSQMPELPTAKQLVSYKEAELNEQAFKLVISPVTSFQAKVLNLSSQVSALAYSNLDSATIVNSAYRSAELSTGLTREQLEYLSTLPDDQQQAYIQAHYNPAAASQATTREAQALTSVFEPLQPLIDQWDAVGKEIDNLYSSADSECKSVFKKYASALASAQGKERNKILLQYYSDIVPLHLKSVTQALQIRLNKQLPIAEQIEARKAELIAQHPDAVLPQVLNYTQMTATFYFLEVSRLLEIPMYNE